MAVGFSLYPMTYSLDKIDVPATQPSTYPGKNPPVPLGTTVHSTDGRKYVYCQFNAAVTVTAGGSIPVKIDKNNLAAASGSGGRIDGVMETSVAATYAGSGGTVTVGSSTPAYGWVCKSGKTTVASAAGGTLDSKFKDVADASGNTVTVAAATDIARGQYLENVASNVATANLFDM